jgi:hypothetical protein
MTCSHSNPPGYAVCGTCGESLPHARCRCGFIAALNDAYCGRCGAALVTAAEAAPQRAAMDADHRFDLERLAAQAAEENKFLETTHKARVTQDDIRKLLAKRRKKF